MTRHHLHEATRERPSLSVRHLAKSSPRSAGGPLDPPAQEMRNGGGRAPTKHPNHFLATCCSTPLRGRQTMQDFLAKAGGTKCKLLQQQLKRTCAGGSRGPPAGEAPERPPKRPLAQRSVKGRRRHLSANVGPRFQGRTDSLWIAHSKRFGGPRRGEERNFSRVSRVSIR
jgi:hypothetical protein